MAIRWLVVAGFVAGLAGCAPKPALNVTDGEGNTVQVDAGGTKVTATDADGKTTTMETSPEGKVTIEADGGKTTYEGGVTVGEADLGVPLYPGARAKDGASARMETTDGKTASVTLATTDSPEEVIAFYQPRLKEANTMTMGQDGGDHRMVGGKTEAGAEVVVTAVRAKDTTETEVTIVSQTPAAK